MNYELSYLLLSTAKSMIHFREKISICIWKQKYRTLVLRAARCKQIIGRTNRFLSKSLSPISSTVIFFYYIQRNLELLIPAAGYCNFNITDITGGSFQIVYSKATLIFKHGCASLQPVGCFEVKSSLKLY